jgi:hypothetical protein
MVLFCRRGTALDNQASGHAKVIHHLVGEGPHQGEDNGVNTRHHQLGPLGREGEENARVRTKNKSAVKMNINAYMFGRFIYR